MDAQSCGAGTSHAIRRREVIVNRTANPRPTCPKTVALVFLLLPLVACKDEGGASAGSDASGAPSGTAAAKPKSPAGESLEVSGPLEVSAGDKSAAFTSGVAVGDGSTLKVLLAAGPLNCDNPYPPSDAMSLEILLDPGPDNDFYSGKTIPVRMDLKIPGDNLTFRTIRASSARIKTSPFTLTGDKVTLSLSFEQDLRHMKDDPAMPGKGSGVVDVVVCKEHSSTTTLAGHKVGAAATGAVAGSLGGDPFTPKRVLAFLVGEGDAAHIDEIGFYEAEDASCEAAGKSVFEGGGVNGLNADVKGVGLRKGGAVPVHPVAVSAAKTEVGVGFRQTFFNLGEGSTRGHLEITAAELKEGGKVKGVVHYETAAGTEKDNQGKLSGTFEAKVCKRSW
jgi:hypothetical protein